MFAPSYRPGGKVRDECWLCSAPVYEGQPAVRYAGIWLHEQCFEQENLSTADPDDHDGDAAAA